MLGIYDFEMALYPVIMDMEYAGFPVDTSNMDIVRDDLWTQQAKIEQEVWSWPVTPFPLSNTDAKRWVMFGEGKRELGEGKRSRSSRRSSRCSAAPRNEDLRR